MDFLLFTGSGSSSISSGSSAGTNAGPPVAAVAGAPRNVRDALNMLNQNKQEHVPGGAYIANSHYSTGGGRNNESDAINGTSNVPTASKKYSGSGPENGQGGSRYNFLY